MLRTRHKSNRYLKNYVYVVGVVGRVIHPISLYCVCVRLCIGLRRVRVGFGKNEEFVWRKKQQRDAQPLTSPQEAVAVAAAVVVARGRLRRCCCSSRNIGVVSFGWEP